MDTLSAQKGGAAGADITLGYLYMKSGTGFPHISFSLMLSSVIISVALFLRPSLYTSLGTNLLMTHWWQLITGRFAHGPQPPVLVHLATNLMVFGLFGVLTERAIRAERLLLLALTAISMELLMRYWMDSWGNGISAVAWAVTPFGLMMAIEGLRRWKSSSGSSYFSLPGS
jgi:membrane associated rhomboid family serine protease